MKNIEKVLFILVLVLVPVIGSEVVLQSAQIDEDNFKLFMLLVSVITSLGLVALIGGREYE